MAAKSKLAQKRITLLQLSENKGNVVSMARQMN
jgi:hypothetical protein